MQAVFTLPQPSQAKRARKFITEGHQANQHCKGRGANPYPAFSLRFEWWDQGWCGFELSDLPEPQRTEMEEWLAGGND